MEKLLLNLIGSAWIVDLLRKLCVFFDWLIYSVSAWFFDVFYDIAKMDMTLGGETSILLVLVERIKLFIGIFALFVFVKLLVSNLANPDRINESGSKVVMKVFVSIILLVVSPTVFDLMNDFQKAVIVDYNTIPKLVLGPTVGEAFDQNAGQSFMGTMFSLFFYCTGECEQESIGAIESVRRGKQPILSLVNYTNATGVKYEYPVLSGVVGMVMIYYFATFAIALGVRIFKLTVLQLLAPIPIITYMDPKREEFCKKYLTLFINTYIEVFVRLFVIIMAYNLGLMIVSALTSAQASDTGVLVKLFLIIALFQFAKAFPKIVSDLFGINSSLGELKGPGGFLGGIAGTAVGFAAGMRSSKLAGVHGLSRAAHVASSVYGGASGGRKGLSSGGIIGGIKGFRDAMYKNSSEGYLRADQIYTSGGYGNYLLAKMHEKSGYTQHHLDRERQRLTDDATHAGEYSNKINSYTTGVSNLGSSFHGVYTKNRKSLETSYNSSKSNLANAESKYNELKQKYNLASNEYKKYTTNNQHLDLSKSSQMSQNISDIKKQMDAAEKDLINCKSTYDSINAAYNKSFEDYLDAMLKKSSDDVNLSYEEKAILKQRDDLVKMVSDIKPNADLSSLAGYEGLSRSLSDAKIDADAKLAEAERTLKDFDKRPDVRISKYKNPE